MIVRASGFVVLNDNNSFLKNLHFVNALNFFVFANGRQGRGGVDMWGCYLLWGNGILFVYKATKL